MVLLLLDCGPACVSICGYVLRTTKKPLQRFPCLPSTLFISSSYRSRNESSGRSRRGRSCLLRLVLRLARFLKLRRETLDGFRLRALRIHGRCNNPSFDRTVSDTECQKRGGGEI